MVPDWIRKHERLAERYGGFVYPWRSRIGPDDGETAYTAWVSAQLRAELDVVEAGCGHGDDALAFAPHVRSYVGYDAVEPFVASARERAAAAAATNLRFVHADSSPKRGGRVPVAAGSTDLMLSRRGPSNFILDARRVCRPGAWLAQVCYLATPQPEWNESLPSELRLPAESDRACDNVRDYMARAELELSSYAIYEVDEHFDAPLELLRRLTWGHEAEPDEPVLLGEVERLFERLGTPDVTLRHRRLLWTAVVP